MRFRFFLRRLNGCFHNNTWVKVISSFTKTKPGHVTFTNFLEISIAKLSNEVNKWIGEILTCTWLKRESWWCDNFVIIALFILCFLERSSLVVMSEVFVHVKELWQVGSTDFILPNSSMHSYEDKITANIRQWELHSSATSLSFGDVLSANFISMKTDKLS